MLVLFETPAGFALFKVLNEVKLTKMEDLWKEFSTSDSARKIVKLKAFTKFENTAEALSTATLLIDSKPSNGLCKFLKAHCNGEVLGVADSKLGNAIKEKLKIDCVHNNAVMELMRGVRSQLTELISDLGVRDLAPMSLGLSHSLSRYKLKFSPDKVDTMIIQAIGLLDDLDKELNTYAMRVREWYGWHFPELAKIVSDNILYAKAVKLIGNRTNVADLDFSEVLPEEIEIDLKEAAVISMGTEVSELDLMNIKELCDQVLSLFEYRSQLYDYLKSRMNAIAPNLTALVGDLVGARLIAHGGSLLNLAKQPGSTIQILGAEKALFRALKTKHATPKYGLIYHASLIGQAAPKHKGKISRTLAAKTILAIRYDALGDTQDNTMGLENRAKVEVRLRNLEGKELGCLAGSTKGKPKIEFYDKDRKKGAGGLLTYAQDTNAEATSEDSLTTDKGEDRSSYASSADQDTNAEATSEDSLTTDKGEDRSSYASSADQDNQESPARKKQKTTVTTSRIALPFGLARPSYVTTTQQKPKSKQADKPKARQETSKNSVTKEKVVVDSASYAEEPQRFSTDPVINLEENPCKGSASNPAVDEVPDSESSQGGDASGNQVTESPRQAENVSFSVDITRLPPVVVSSSRRELGLTSDFEHLFAEVAGTASIPRRRDVGAVLATLASPSYRDMADLGQPARLLTADEHFSLTMLDANRQLSLLSEVRAYSREKIELLKAVEVGEQITALLQKEIDEVKSQAAQKDREIGELNNKASLLYSQVIEAKKEFELANQIVLDKVAELSVKEADLMRLHKVVNCEQTARLNVELDLGQARSEAKSTKESLEGQVTELKKELADAKADLQDYLDEICHEVVCEFATANGLSPPKFVKGQAADEEDDAGNEGGEEGEEEDEEEEEEEETSGDGNGDKDSQQG